MNFWNEILFYSFMSDENLSIRDQSLFLDVPKKLGLLAYISRPM